MQSLEEELRTLIRSDHERPPHSYNPPYDPPPYDPSRQGRKTKWAHGEPPKGSQAQSHMRLLRLYPVMTQNIRGLMAVHDEAVTVKIDIHVEGLHIVSLLPNLNSVWDHPQEQGHASA